MASEVPSLVSSGGHMQTVLCSWDNSGVNEPAEVSPPFRWDLVTPAQLGSLLAGTREPDLWFRDALVECAGKVLARCGGGDIVFVGRSLDSMFDLLGGALGHIATGPCLYRLPVSFQRPAVRGAAGRWEVRPLTAAEQGQARRMLAGLGLAPHALARRDRPVTFVDVVNHGSTFTELFTVLRRWIGEEHAQIDVIRRKLRFTGVTVRRKTSPNTYRWQQEAGWTRELPAGAVVNVSLDGPAWSYFGDHQAKLTRSFRPDQWLADAGEPGRGEATRQALAEAVALVSYGRSAQGRRALARAASGEPALARPWLRSLVLELNRST
jgi:hypothetical protein